jgi:outer membrane protein
MSKSGFLALLAAGIFATCAAQAQQQPWIVKGGLGYMMPKNNPGNVDFDDGKVAVEFDDAWAGIFSVGYMFDEHWAGEMYVATPFQTDITFRGVGQGEADLVPLTFSALYYFNPNGRWRPYLGAGINFTEFYGEKPNQLHLGGSLGPAATEAWTSCSPGIGSQRSTCAGSTSTPRSRRTAARMTSATSR